MKRLLVAAVISLFFVTSSWSTTNYNSSKSNVYLSFPNAMITTASISFPGGVVDVVYTTPATGDFILTQFCAGPNWLGSVELDAAYGTIAEAGNGMGCYTFTPGMSIPPNSALSCSAAASAARGIQVTHFCTISGMQTTPSASTPVPTATATVIPAT